MSFRHAIPVISALLWLSASAQDTAPPAALPNLPQLLQAHGFANPAPGPDGVPVQRIAAVLRREQALNELNRLLAYREDRRIPTPAAAGKAIRAADAPLAALKAVACGGDEQAYAKALAEADDRLAAAWAQLDRHWPDRMPMRGGLGPYTFGRFGWRERFAGLVWDLVDWDCLASPYTPSRIHISPVGATLAERTGTDISWVSARHRMAVRGPHGSIDWTVTESVLVPGILVETPAAALQVSRGRDAQRGPDRLLVPAADSALSIQFRADREVPIPEDNWILLAWERESGHPPVLVVFETLPASIQWTDQALVLGFPNGAGKVALGSYAGVEPWSPETSKGWQAVPRDVLRHCRALAANLTHFPVGMEELFSLDARTGEIVVVSRPEYRDLSYSGTVSKQPATPLPPTLGTVPSPDTLLAATQLVQPYTMPTRNGPYRLSMGTAATYRLPICRYDHCLAPAEGSIDRPLSLDKQIDLGTLCQHLATWPGLSAENRDRLAKTAKQQLEARLAGLAGPGGYVVEPNTLTLCVDPTAGKAPAGSSQALREASLLLDATYRYAKYSGDWSFALDHRQAIEDLLRSQMAMTDWSLLAPLPRDASALDALPDALRGALAASQLAEAIDDAETLRLARYLTARLLICYQADFRLAAPTDRLRWQEFGPPACGQDLGVRTAVARVAGLPIMPELIDVAMTGPRFAATQWLQKDVPALHPDWASADLDAAGTYWLLSQVFSVSPKPGRQDQQAILGHLPTDSPFAGLLPPPTSAPPLRLAEWQPASLGQFIYDREKGIVRLELTGATRLRCTARIAPITIFDNHVELLRSAWSYSTDQSRLFLPLGPGPHHLTFVFAAENAAEPAP